MHKPKQNNNKLTDKLSVTVLTAFELSDSTFKTANASPDFIVLIATKSVDLNNETIPSTSLSQTLNINDKTNIIIGVTKLVKLSNIEQMKPQIFTSPTMITGL